MMSSRVVTYILIILSYSNNLKYIVHRGGLAE